MENNSSSQHLYNEKIHRVIDYISEHISEEINLDQLAEVACFSPFHFHRIFTAFIGETPRDFIERIKLEKAANKICLMPHILIADIAEDCGFSSASTFNRASKKHCQVSPREFLKRHREDFHSMNIPGYHSRTSSYSLERNLVYTDRLDSTHIAFIQVLNSYSVGIPKSWQRLISYSTIHGWLKPDTRFIGVPYDNPGITPREKCRYRAYISVDKSIIISHGEIKTTDIEEGFYAILHFKGETKDITNAYSFLYGTWLPQS